MKVNLSFVRSRAWRIGFTLIEVMIALMIFFMAVFTILGVVSTSLRNARALQGKTVDSGTVAAQKFFEITYTNKVTEGGDDGNFGDVYRDYSWTTDTYEVGSNGLYQCDIAVLRRGGGFDSKLAILVFNPNAPGTLTRGMAAPR